MPLMVSTATRPSLIWVSGEAKSGRSRVPLRISPVSPSQIGRWSWAVLVMSSASVQRRIAYGRPW